MPIICYTKECLRNNIVPFIIDEDTKLYYYCGLKERERKRVYLRDTCLAAQDKSKRWASCFDGRGEIKLNSAIIIICGNRLKSRFDCGMLSYDDPRKEAATMDAAMVLKPDQHFYSISELRAAGLTYYKINRLVNEGRLIKLNNKVYQNTSFAGEESDIAFATVYAPKGVVCMMSAARHYGLTSFLPEGVDIAIERNMKISTLPDWPQINLWYFPEKRYSAGTTTSSDGACTFSIYEVEKTVADILYYRNKVGIEETKEVLKNYLRREDRDLAKLHRYADALGCKKILGTYMEVLV